MLDMMRTTCCRNTPTLRHISALNSLWLLSLLLHLTFFLVIPYHKLSLLFIVLSLELLLSDHSLATPMVSEGLVACPSSDVHVILWLFYFETLFYSTFFNLIVKRQLDLMMSHLHVWLWWTIVIIRVVISDYQVWMLWIQVSLLSFKWFWLWCRKPTVC